MNPLKWVMDRLLVRKRKLEVEIGLGRTMISHWDGEPFWTGSDLVTKTLDS